MQETLLIIHIFGAAMLFGGGVMALMVGPRMGAAGGETALGWAKMAGILGRRFAAIEGADFPTAGVLAKKAGKIGMTTKGVGAYRDRGDGHQVGT